MVATRRRMMPMMWRTKMAARRISMLTVLERERERENKLDHSPPFYYAG